MFYSFCELFIIFIFNFSRRLSDESDLPDFGAADIFKDYDGNISVSLASNQPTSGRDADLNLIGAFHSISRFLPDVCPNRGFCPMISMIRAVGICCSFHLKMSVPFGLRTRIHSSNPCRMSSSHEGRRRPYFFASHDDSPRLFRCGGSNRTR